MTPLRQAPPASHKRRAVEEDAYCEQAGRSTTSLGVEKETADIRRKPVPPHPVQRETSETSIHSAGLRQGWRSPRRESPTGRGDRRSSYAPTVSSPFNPSASQTSLGNHEYRGVVSGSISPVTLRSPLSETPPNMSSGNIPLLGRGGRKGSGVWSPTQQSARYSPTLMTPSNYTPRPERPKLLHDLGRDYSRYPSTISAPSSYIGSPVPKDPIDISVESKASLLSDLTTDAVNLPNSQSNLEKCGYPDDSIGAFDPYFGGEKGFILFKDEIEADDKHHLPADDDDQTYKPKLSDYLHRRAVVSGIGGVFLVIGLVFLFIIVPALTFSSRGPIPLHSHNQTHEEPWLFVNNKTHSMLKNARRGLIDPDTPDKAKTRKSTFDGSTLNLVFSDEFNEDGRTFYEGDDPYWTAPNIWYGSTKDLEWYDPDAVTTKDGTLQLRMDEFENHELHYRSGMLNSWNQFCFKGGVFEVSVSLAGPSGVPGYVLLFNYPYFS